MRVVLPLRMQCIEYSLNVVTKLVIAEHALIDVAVKHATQSLDSQFKSSNSTHTRIQSFLSCWRHVLTEAEVVSNP